MTQSGLDQHVQTLCKFLMQPGFVVEALVSGMRKYFTFLKENLQRNSMQQHSTELIRSPVEDVIMITIPASNEPVKSEYTDLSEAMDELPDYRPIFLNDYAPDDRFERRTWISKLELPLNLFVYRYPYGNYLGTFRRFPVLWTRL